MHKVFTRPPALAALAFTLPESFQLMTRPNSIYIPFVAEIPVFAISYIVLAILNAIVIVPMAKVLMSRTSSFFAGCTFAVVVSLVGICIIFAMEIFGHKSSILHRAYISGSLLPLLLLSAGTFYLPARVPDVVASRPGTGT
jgi:uncharacterized membrane protein YadS